MSICTRCPHGAADSDGNLLPKFKNRAWEKVPCSTCTLVHGHYIMSDADRSNQGMITLSRDALVHHGQGDFGGEIAIKPPERSEADTAQDMAAAIIRAVYQLERNDREIVMMRFSGLLFSEIAKDLKMTTQGIHQRWLDILASWPALAKAMPSRSWRVINVGNGDLQHVKH